MSRYTYHDKPPPRYRHRYIRCVNNTVLKILLVVLFTLLIYVVSLFLAHQSLQEYSRQHVNTCDCSLHSRLRKKSSQCPWVRFQYSSDEDGAQEHVNAHVKDEYCEYRYHHSRTFNTQVEEANYEQEETIFQPEKTFIESKEIIFEPPETVFEPKNTLFESKEIKFDPENASSEKIKFERENTYFEKEKFESESEKDETVFDSRNTELMVLEAPPLEPVQPSLSSPAYVEPIRSGEKSTFPTFYDNDYSFIHDCKDRFTKDTVDPFITFLIRSSPSNFASRSVIRQTWALEGTHPGVMIRSVFLLGVDGKDEKIQPLIDKEAQMNGDLVQARIIDTYANLSLKVVMGMKWTREVCPNSKFYVIADDDSFIVPNKLIWYLKYELRTQDMSKLEPLENNLKQKEPEVTGPEMNGTDVDEPEVKESEPKKGYEDLRQKYALMFKPDIEDPNDFDENNEDSATSFGLENKEPMVYAGRVVNSSQPLRVSSRWQVTSEQFPYDSYPPYVSGCCTVISRPALVRLLRAARYTKLLPLEDVYLGLLAVRAQITPISIPGIYCGGLDLETAGLILNYPNLIVDHRYTAGRMLATWAILEARGRV